MKPVFIILISLSSLSCKENQTTNNNRQQLPEKKSEGSIKKQDSFSQWQGNYQGNFEISRTDGDYQVNYDVKLVNKDNISITEKINDESNPVSGIFIESVSDDKLIIKSKTGDTLEYIIGKINGKYYLMGNTIYMLNPPNDRYLLKKGS